MRQQHILVVAVLVLLVRFCPIYSQLVSINPPALEFVVSSTALLLEIPTSVELAVRIDAESWSVNCLAQPLIATNSNTIIPETNLFIHHEYSPADDAGAGSGYQPMNTTISLGNGEATGFDFKVVNHLNFKIRLPEEFVPDLYHAEIRIQYGDALQRQEEVILDISIRLQTWLTVEPVTNRLVGSISGEPGLYEIPANLILKINSNVASNEFNLALSPFQGENGAIIGSGALFIQIPEITAGQHSVAGADYVSLSEPYSFGVNLNLVESTTPYFEKILEIFPKVKTSWFDRTGTYRAQLEMTSKNELMEPLSFPIQLEIMPISTMNFSATGVNFHANGPPAIWNGDPAVKLIVGSNCGQWSVQCQATDLVSPKGTIPKSRLFIKRTPTDFLIDEGAGAQFQSLKTDLEIIQGVPTEPAEVSEMQFRLKTLETDLPGHYEGLLIFTLLVNP